MDPVYVADSMDDVVVGLFKARFTAPVTTVMVLVAVLAPSCVVTVMMAVPGATAVTNPLALTVATAVLLELQLTILFVAFDGETVAVTCCVVAAEMEAEAGETVTPVTATVVQFSASVIKLSK